MEAVAPASWVESARTTARILGGRALEKPEAPARSGFPLAAAFQTGLRSLEQTQSLEALETKGRIIDLFL